MKLECQVDIRAPRNKVVELFDCPDNLGEWQDGFQSFEMIEGSPGEVGSKARLVYLMGKKRMELIETITVNDMPREFSGRYEHIHMDNTMRNFFEEIEGGRATRYRAEVEYTELKSLMVRVMAKLFPGMFKKQVQKWINQFRDFVEREVSGSMSTSKSPS